MNRLRQATFEEWVLWVSIGLFIALIMFFGYMFVQELNHCRSIGGVTSGDGLCHKKESILSP